MKAIQVKQDRGYQTVNITVQPITEAENDQNLLMILFQDAAPVKTKPPYKAKSKEAKRESKRLAELEQDLASTREYLQTTIEELETTNEELKSTNEELQSSNEELQSTNEELETSKEELQSVNEELITVNSELHTKIEELSKSNNDMNNLLVSTKIGTIFLDTNLRVKRFTPAGGKIFNLIQTDIGRPVAHIVSNLQYENLSQEVEDVLKTLVPKETEVKTRDDTWYFMRIMPYRTLENVIDGIVLTLSNISSQKKVEGQLRKLTRAVEQSGSMVLITDVDGDIEYVNPKFTTVTGYSFEEVKGKNPRILKSGKHSKKFYKEVWDTLLSGKEWHGEFHNRKKNGELYWESESISPIKNDKGEITHFVAVRDDITEKKKRDDIVLKLVRR